MKSTTAATRIVPEPPVPPVCVTSLEKRIATDRFQKEQDALIKDQLIEYFRDEIPGLVEQKGLWNVVAALKTVLAEERSPSTGGEMVCHISLRDAQEVNGWY